MQLKSARRLLERTGWVGPKHEPFCVARGPGVRVNPAFGPDSSSAEPMWLHAGWHHTLDAGAEGLERFSVHGVLIAAGAYPDGWDALERVVGEPLQQWLQEPKRTEGDVLRVFTTAVLRSREKRT